MFLNSQEWKNFQKSVGRAVFDLDERNYLIKLSIPFNKSYLYSTTPLSQDFLDSIKEIGKKEGAIFFKFEPMVIAAEIDIKKGLKKSKKELQPQRTIILDLNKNKENLLLDMHQKHRYNIRLAEKKGISVRLSEDKEKEFEKFWELLQKTSERDNFHTHTKEYYKKLLGMDIVKVFFAEKDKNLHAAAVIIFHNNRATYLHGASDYSYRSDMAPHLLHWEIIKYAKDLPADRHGKNFSEYDFWGIDEHKWPGVTRFERGFGGREMVWAGSFDYPLKKFLYSAYSIKSTLLP